MKKTNANNNSFIMLKRSQTTLELMKDPNCWVLLSQIAYRAMRTNNYNIYNLKKCQALVGDIESIGLTQAEYRTALKKLVKWKFITTERTNKGTIATLINTDIFDINAEKDDNQSENQTYIKHRSSTQQINTNKNDNNNKKGKNDKNDKQEADYDVFDKLIQMGVKQSVARNLV
jgi:hypothetical protein